MKFPSFKKTAKTEQPGEEKPQQKKTSSPAGGKKSRTQLLLLVLLLVVLGGVGVCYYLDIPIIPGITEPAPQTPLAPVVKRQPVAKPETTAAVKKPIPKPPATNPQTVPVKPAPAEVKPVAKEVVPVAAVAAVKSQPPQQQSEVKPQPAAAKKEHTPAPPQVVDEKQAVAPMPKVSAEKVAMPQSGAYSVRVGTFLIPASVKKARDVIRKLGFEPVVDDVRQTVNMTRLRADVYPDKAAAAARVVQLKSAAPDAFYLKVGDEYHVYVGSYYNLDGARRFADQLYTRGILLEEENVSIEQTLQQVSFGSFAGKQEAETAAARARKKGLDAVVSKVR